MSVNGDALFDDPDDVVPQAPPLPQPPAPVTRRFIININLVGHSINDAAVIAGQIVRDFPGAAGVQGNIAALAAPAGPPEQEPVQPAPAAAAPRPPKCKICFMHRSNRLMPACGHFSCDTCLIEWLRINPRCPDPHCRRPCLMNDLIVVNF